MSDQFDPKDDGARMDFRKTMSYGDYLQIDKILDAQAPLSQAPDELLFIIQHQTSELWMKLLLHELADARAAIAADDLPPAFKLLARVSRILEQLNNAWDVLRTMTPSDYTTFRDALGESSGFQSYQYRMIEFILGNRNTAMLRPHAHRPDLMAALEEELAKPSIYDEVLNLCVRQGMDLPKDALNRDRAKPHNTHPAIIAMWKTVYQDTKTHWTLYETAEKLVDIEDYFRRWRFNHLTTVERVIGMKRGTGGTGGTSYLSKMLSVELFPDLWRVRTEL